MSLSVGWGENETEGYCIDDIGDARKRLGTIKILYFFARNLQKGGAIIWQTKILLFYLVANTLN